MSSSPHIRILMGTLNGADYLPAQLESFLTQSHRDWSLWISDDGSEDATPEILEAFRAAHPDRDIRVYWGPQQGITRNYFSLLTRCAPETNMLVALSDQDDVWLPGKLARAAAAFADGAGPAVPVAYASAQILVDEDLRRQRPSRRCPAGPSFANALVQNILSGSSLVLNAAAVGLLLKTAPAARVPCHDWWIYQVITGAGGRAIYDPEPGLLYRQHGANTLGGNLGLRALRRRAGLIWGRDYTRWIEANTAALAAAAEWLTPENRALLDQFRARPGQGGLARARRLVQLGVKRQTGTGTLALLLAVLLGRV